MCAKLVVTKYNVWPLPKCAGDAFRQEVLAVSVWLVLSDCDGTHVGNSERKVIDRERLKNFF